MPDGVDDYFDPDKLEELPAISPGATVLIQLRDTGVGTPQPDGSVTWVHERCEPAEMVIQDRDECDHKDTICLDCVHSWQLDWIINLPETPEQLGLKEA